MSTRKIKDAKDLNDGSLIYFKGHAKATYMSDGTTVEDAINNIEVGTGGTNGDLSKYATKEELNSKQDTITDLETIRQGAAKGATSVQQGTLSTVATSGSYNDLTNKPTIPAVVTESTVSDWGFTKNVGTITGVSANGTSIATSGVANIPAASTSAYGVTKLSSSTSSTSTSLAATASAVKSAYDLANGRQEKLVSGTNIKTINGQSLLGSGNISISGSESSSGSSAYPLVNHGTSDTTFTLTPNTLHMWVEVANLTLTLGSETSGVANEYLFQFTSGTTPTTLSLPNSIRWQEDLTIEANKIYQISILNGLGTVMSWEYTSQGDNIGGGGI